MLPATAYEPEPVPLTRNVIGCLRDNNCLKATCKYFRLSRGEGTSAGRAHVLLVLQRLPSDGVVRDPLQAARGAG